MTTYNSGAVANTVIAYQKPITLQQGRALRDNPLAMFEGAAGAPSLEQPAMGSWYYGTGGVGTLAFLVRQVPGVGSIVVAGSTYAGSQLQYTGVGGINGLCITGASPSGTWRALGSSDEAGGTARNATLFIRIA